MALFQETDADPRAAAARLADLLAWFGAIGDLANGDPAGLSTRKAQAAASLARALEAEQPELDAIFFAAQLHAIGALGNDACRKGEGLPPRLARMERWDIPAQGARVAEHIGALPATCADLIRWQDERWDGTGSPDQLRWTTIPRGAQILALADCFARIEQPEEALTAVSQESGRRFSPEMARSFLLWLHLNGGDPEATPTPNTALDARKCVPDSILRDIADRIDDHNGVRGRWRRVATIAERIAKEIGIDDQGLATLELACATYGSGELAARDVEESLYDPLARLGIEERARNATLAAQLVERFRALAHLTPILRARAEWFDGTGKPRGLGRDAIPALSQILAVSIAFDALLRNRTASASNNPDLLATHRLDDASGTQFDPDIVRALIRVAGSLS